VNDKKIGKIKSKALATAFANIYTDSKAVCKLKPVLEGEEQPSGVALLFPVAASVAIVAITTVFLIQRKRTKPRQDMRAEI